MQGGATGGSSMGTSTDTMQGGTSGGSMSTSTDTMSGGMTGGAGTTMSFSYDQRDQFIKTERTKLDGFNRRVEMLRTNARNAPQNVNTTVMPKIEELSKMSNDIKGKIDKVKNSPREQWDSTRMDIENSMTQLEQQLMSTEQTFR
jgi:hypothetical protein